MHRDFARCFVSLRLLLKRGRHYLFLRLAESNCWDLPGGRINRGEEHMPLEKIIVREIREELGPAVRYRLGPPLFQFRRYSAQRHTYNFSTVYAATYRGGAIRLSNEHSRFIWLDPRTCPFRREDFFNAEEYRAFLRHFSL